MPTALISAYTKNHRLGTFTAELVRLGWDLLASSGTKAFLDKFSIPSTDIATLVGEPILGHRVVTLDRRIYAAILSDLTNKEHLAELERIKMAPINLVCVDLYPLLEELANPKRTFDSVIDKTDIGGPTLLRAAAKGRRYVVSSPTQFTEILNFLEHPPDAMSVEGVMKRSKFLSKLAADAEKVVMHYAAASASFHEAVANGTFFDRKL